MKSPQPRHIALSLRRTFALAPRYRRASGGFTLIELVITMTVLAILSLGVIPMIKTAVKRQREQQLREALREMRESIKEFHRDALNSPYLDQNAQAAGGGIVGEGGGITAGTGGAAVGGAGAAAQAPPDPRSKVAIADKTIFTVDNPDRYPPKLETLVDGVNVAPRQVPGLGGGAGGTTNELPKLGDSALAFKKKIYLRKIPVDPITGKTDWVFRSCYDPPDAGSGGNENIFDVHSKSDDVALNGQKYSDW